MYPHRYEFQRAARARGRELAERTDNTDDDRGPFRRLDIAELKEPRRDDEGDPDNQADDGVHFAGNYPHGGALLAALWVGSLYAAEQAQGSPLTLRANTRRGRST